MSKREPSAIRIEGDVAYVTLTKGFEAVIDTSDVPLIAGYVWRVFTLRKGHTYATRAGDRPRTMVLMHRELMGAAQGQLIDHKDGDGLNNRRANIRFATYQQNNANMVVSSRNLLGIKGISQERSGKYGVRIKFGGRSFFVGTFSTQAEASAAYYGAARIMFGDFAKK